VDRPVSYRVAVAGREFDVTIAPGGEALVVEVAAVPEDSGASQSSARAEPLPRLDLDGRAGEGDASRRRWRAQWRRRGPRAFSLALAPATALGGDAPAEGSSWTREVLVAAADRDSASGTDASGALGASYWLAVDGYQEEARVAEALAVRLAAALPRRAGAAARLEVRAPMPGRVVSVRVAVGQVVERGDLVATLEAMKMENELRAPGAGRVQALHVGAGDTVEHGALILVLAPPEATDAERGASDPE